VYPYTAQLARASGEGRHHRREGGGGAGRGRGGKTTYKAARSTHKAAFKDVAPTNGFLRDMMSSGTRVLLFVAGVGPTAGLDRP